MAVTLTATLIGTYRSRVTAALISAATANAETITLVHLLGASPHEIRVIPRSITSAPSSNPYFCVVSQNASQATIIMASGLGAREVNVDIISEVTHSIVQ